MPTLCKSIWANEQTHEAFGNMPDRCMAFACSECGKDFRQKESFTWHMKQEHPKDGEDNSKYFCICQICSTRYKTRSGLEQHKCHGPVQEKN